MGIKMDKAKFNGQTVKIKEYDVNKEYCNLKCYHCSANVGFVNSHERDLGEKKVIVHRYFRLKKGETHDDGCDYTVDGAVKNIFAACADRELMDLQNNRYVVRLLLVSDDTEDKSTDTKVDGSGNGKRKPNYIPSGKKTSYLSTMNQIMKLRTMVENDSDLEELVNLQFYDWDNKPFIVPWKNFYYDMEIENDYERMLRYIKKNKVYHPICLIGLIKSIGKYRKDNYDRYYIKLESVSISEKERISITVYFSDEKMYSELLEKEGSKIVLYSKVKFYRSKDWIAPDKKVITYQNVTANIYDKRQLMILNEG